MSQEPKTTKVRGLIQRDPVRQGVPGGIAHVLAVHSGKGGVGKTFIAVNLALFLADRGYKVGLLDADIDCPNVFKMLKVKGKLAANAEKKIVPLEARVSGAGALKVISMAAMQERENQVFLWRGPIVSRAVEQLLYDTAWGELDFLIVDLPPGTSDIPISILKMVASAPLNSALKSASSSALTSSAESDLASMLIVSTPQKLALLDAQKSLELAKEMRVQVAGIIENMAGEVFGSGQVQKLAQKAGVPFLGSVPLKHEYAAMKAGSAPAYKGPELQKIFSGLLDCVFVQ